MENPNIQPYVHVHSLEKRKQPVCSEYIIQYELGVRQSTEHIRELLHSHVGFVTFLRARLGTAGTPSVFTPETI